MQGESSSTFITPRRAILLVVLIGLLVVLGIVLVYRDSALTLVRNFLPGNMSCVKEGQKFATASNKKCCAGSTAAVLDKTYSTCAVEEAETKTETNTVAPTATESPAVSSTPPTTSTSTCETFVNAPSDSTINFGQVTLPGYTTLPILTIKNCGTGAMSAGALSLSSSDTDFKIITAPVALNVGESLEVLGRFSPATAGDHFATLTIRAGADTLAITASGQALAQ